MRWPSDAARVISPGCPSLAHEDFGSHTCTSTASRLVESRSRFRRPIVSGSWIVRATTVSAGVVALPGVAAACGRRLLVAGRLCRGEFRRSRRRCRRDVLPCGPACAVSREANCCRCRRGLTVAGRLCHNVFGWPCRGASRAAAARPAGDEGSLASYRLCHNGFDPS